MNWMKVLVTEQVIIYANENSIPIIDILRKTKILIKEHISGFFKTIGHKRTEEKKMLVSIS